MNNLLSYISSGQGMAVVFIHGFCEDQSIWENFAVKLSNSCRVITLDLPGFGNSENQQEYNTIEGFALEVNHLLEYLEIKTCILVGHSLGGYVALAFAELFPHKVSGICLFHSTAFPDSEEKKLNRNKTIDFIQRNGVEGFVGMLFQGLFTSENQIKYSKEIEYLIEKAKKLHPKNVILAIEAMRERKNRIPFLASFPQPILYIVGKQDQAVLFESSLAQLGVAPNSSSLCLQHVAHMGMIEDEKSTFLALEGFINYCSMDVL